MNDPGGEAVNPALALGGSGALHEARRSAFHACRHVVSQGGCFLISGL